MEEAVKEAILKSVKYLKSIQYSEGDWRSEMRVPTQWLTEHALMRWMNGEDPSSETIQSICDYLELTQEEDGSWTTFPGCSYPGSIVRNYVALKKFRPDSKAIQKAEKKVQYWEKGEYLDNFKKHGPNAYFFTQGKYPASIADDYLPDIRFDMSLVPPPKQMGVMTFRILQWLAPLFFQRFELQDTYQKRNKSLVQRKHWNRRLFKMIFTQPLLECVPYINMNILLDYWALDVAMCALLIKAGYTESPTTQINPKIVESAFRLISQFVYEDGTPIHIYYHYPLVYVFDLYGQKELKEKLLRNNAVLHSYKNGYFLGPNVCLNIYDTALTTIALLDAGLDKNDPCIKNAVSFLKKAQSQEDGSWGWGYHGGMKERKRGGDGDSSGMSATALLKAGEDPGGLELKMALQWFLSIQHSSGGFKTYPTPFGSTVTVCPTARCAAALYEAGIKTGNKAYIKNALKAVDWFIIHQLEDGSWRDGWLHMNIPGTALSIAALRKLGLPSTHASIQKAAFWLCKNQLSNGAWGLQNVNVNPETNAPHELSSLDPPGVEPTAWAVYGLIKSGDTGEKASKAIEAGIRYLLSKQTDDGSFGQPAFVGRFVWYWNYGNRLFPIHYSLQALTSYLSSKSI